MQALRRVWMAGLGCLVTLIAAPVGAAQAGTAQSVPTGTAQSVPVGAAQPVYRLYYPFTGEHLQTTDAHEVSVLTTLVVLDGVRFVWQTEHPTFMAYKASSAGCPAGSDPVYRMYDGSDGDHLLTADANELSYWTQRHLTSWVAEGVAFCAGHGEEPFTVPVYRILRADGHEHFLTADPQEFGRLVASGWGHSEGIAFYGPTS